MTTQDAVVSPVLVNRFADAVAFFTGAVEDAVTEASLNPEFADTPQLRVWQQASSFIRQQNASVQHGLALYLIGELRTIVSLASEKRHLARELDGCDLNFAGPDRGKVLDQLETAVVVAAYQVCAAAKVP
ncbi:MAG TPA: hypothetical protein VHX20_06790 [Terracidiphilus sp.]|jgi:hypothetical protein|nr:hypothetical protein [Terracidiphilus sp.]